MSLDGFWYGLKDSDRNGFITNSFHVVHKRGIYKGIHTNTLMIARGDNETVFRLKHHNNHVYDLVKCTECQSHILPVYR